MRQFVNNLRFSKDDDKHPGRLVRAHIPTLPPPPSLIIQLIRIIIVFTIPIFVIYLLYYYRKYYKKYPLIYGIVFIIVLICTLFYYFILWIARISSGAPLIMLKKE